MVRFVQKRKYDPEIRAIIKNIIDKRVAAPQAKRDMGFPTADKDSVDKERLATMKEKSQKQGLSDDELMDVLGDVLG